MQTSIWTFVIITLLVTASGALAIVRKKKTTSDYLVASRGVAPWLTALSTVGTNNSGFMFIGMIAYTYRVGVQSSWMMFGWLAGDLLAWLLVHRRVRELSESTQTSTLPALIGTRSNHREPLLTRTAGLITLVFLTVYASAQLKAGSTALHALFGWPMYAGALVGAGIVLLYSYAGGIRADIWTDAAQSFVMFVSMLALVIAGFNRVGGPGAVLDGLRAQDPALVTWVPSDLLFGLPGLVGGFVFAGIGVVGQPHLMSRLMAIDSVRSIGPARNYYFLWFVPFWIASVMVGLYARVLIPSIGDLEVASGLAEPTELALPLLTMELLPDFFIGLALAGLFAASVSTADSQIIVCSGAITHDLYPRWSGSYLASKTGTFAVLTVALAVALFAPEGVFALVLVAWSAMGASLGAPLIVRVLGWPLRPAVGSSMMAIAVAVVVAWQLAGLDDDVFKMLPGMLAAFLVYGAARLWQLARDRFSP